MDLELTRRAFLKTLAAVSLPLFVPIELLGETLILEGPVIDEAVFSRAVRVDCIQGNEVHASIDTGLALSAMTFTDQHGGIWRLETEGDAQECGGLQIKALVSEGRRIEV